MEQRDGLGLRISMGQLPLNASAGSPGLAASRLSANNYGRAAIPTSSQVTHLPIMVHACTRTCLIGNSTDDSETMLLD